MLKWGYEKGKLETCSSMNVSIEEMEVVLCADPDELNNTNTDPLPVNLPTQTNLQNTSANESASL